MKKFDYDVVIIGGGSAGYAAARTGAAGGLKIAVVEGGRDVGGLCILRGCMPSKTLLYISEVLHLAKNAAPFGVSTKNVRFDFKKIMARKNRLVGNFADYRAGQLQKFPFLRATARFLDPHTVALEPAGAGAKGATAVKKRITAGHFIITTGSIVAPPPLPELRETGYITSDEALALKRLPASLIVLGGGPTACELAQFFARLGVKTTIIQRSPHILHDFDADAAAALEGVFRREGIQLFTGTRLLGARRNGRVKTVCFEHNGKPVSVSAGEILFALGRIPNTASLDLEKAGVKTERCRVLCNHFMQTSAPHIFAGGDCAGPYEIVHIAVQQGEVAARNILRPGSTAVDYRLLIAVVFTEPQLAFVGLTEKEAAARGIACLAASYPFNDHGKSLIMEATDGFVKLLAAPKSGEILGGQCVGPLGGELIHEIVAAMSKRMTVHELAAMPHYHPTLAEIWTYPAEELAEKIGPPGP